MRLSLPAIICLRKLSKRSAGLQIGVSHVRPRVLEFADERERLVDWRLDARSVEPYATTERSLLWPGHSSGGCRPVAIVLLCRADQISKVAPFETMEPRRQSEKLTIYD